MVLSIPATVTVGFGTTYQFRPFHPPSRVTILLAQFALFKRALFPATRVAQKDHCHYPAWPALRLVACEQFTLITTPRHRWTRRSGRRCCPFWKKFGVILRVCTRSAARRARCSTTPATVPRLPCAANP